LDLIVGPLEKGSAVSIQVKTSEFAHRSRKRDKTEWWSWRVGKQVASLRGDSIFYAFVSLENDKQGSSRPVTFIVPWNDVAKRVKTDGPDAYWFSIEGKECQEAWKEAWHLITDKLGKLP
jgi:hypothetical protein